LGRVRPAKPRPKDAAIVDRKVEAVPTVANGADGATVLGKDPAAQEPRKAAASAALSPAVETVSGARAREKAVRRVPPGPPPGRRPTVGPSGIQTATPVAATAMIATATVKIGANRAGVTKTENPRSCGPTDAVNRSSGLLVRSSISNGWSATANAANRALSRSGISFQQPSYFNAVDVAIAVQ